MKKLLAFVFICAGIVAAEIPNPNGKWDVSISKDELTDNKTVFLSLIASSGLGKYGDPVYLIIRCQNNKTEMFINWQTFLGLDTIEAIDRVDDKKAETSYWDISTDRKASFRRNPVPQIKKMLDSKKYVAQVTPYSENPITAVFETDGLGNAIKELRETCSW